METKNLQLEKIKELFNKSLTPKHKIVMEIRKKYSFHNLFA